MKKNEEKKEEYKHRKKIDTMSSLKVRNLVSDLNLENSVKIVQSPKTSKSKPQMLQSKIDAWVNSADGFGNRTELKEN